MKREYPCVEINLGKITHNTSEIIAMCNKKAIDITGVTKVFCAKKPIIKAMIKGGLKSIADSRLSNLKRVEDIECEKILLRIPMPDEAGMVVKYTDISLNSELETIKRLSKAAKRAKKHHGVILMVDLGDLREGVLEYDVLDTVKEIIKLENIKLLGIGTNLSCYGGIIPDEKNLGKLVDIKGKVESILEINLPIVSGGNSSSLYLVMNDNIPKGINQLRIGEGIVLGRETAYGKDIENCHKDCFTLKGEIVEIKNKPSVPIGKIGMDAFGQTPTFEDRGIIKRAIIAIGKQDIRIEGLIPLDKKIKILGGSSDHLILDVTESKNEYKVGDIINFNMDYGSLLQGMTSPYVCKYYID